MATEFSKIVGLISTATGLLKQMSEKRLEAKTNEIAISLQGIILELQAETLTIQERYFALMRSREEFEQKVLENDRWDKESQRYHLAEVGKGWRAFVYALNVKNPAVEPLHWLCTHCYQDRKKSILQRNFAKTAIFFLCPRCKLDYLIDDIPK